MKTLLLPSRRTTMLRRMLALPALCLALAGCNALLDTEPVNQASDKTAINSPASARLALTGAYASLTTDALYGGDMLVFGDLYADNARHIGTFSTYEFAGLYQLRADNGDINRIWTASYVTIDRANRIVQKVPGVAGLSDEERDDIVGQALTLRAVSYHNLVRVFGPVPLVLVPPTGPDEASQVTRADTGAVYTQIVADLTEAAAKVTNTSNTQRVTAGAVQAMLARVYLYRGQWADAVTAADAVTGLGYDLADTYEENFPAVASDSPEDLWKVYFDIADYQLIGYYYRARGFEGRSELSYRPQLLTAFEAGDARFTWSIDTVNDQVTKWPTGDGAENMHVIRYAEVVLIKAEALARQDQLGPAVDEYNKIRVRAGLAPHTLGTEVTTQQQVLDAIDHERRLELMFEGDRFPDLVRTGRAVAAMGIEPFRQLWPVPLPQLNVSPNLTQNPQY